MSRTLGILLLSATLVFPQMKVSIQQLRDFLSSSRKLGHEDRRVGEYLRKMTLTERLDDRTIEDMQAIGLGPKTLEALRALRDASTSLPAPRLPEPKPAPAVIPPPPADEQKKIIEHLRAYALNYTKRLPDFICTQVTRRHIDPTGMEFWRRQDVIVTRLSFFEQKEDYKVILVNDRPSELDIRQVGGATSTGEFGTMLREIFEPATETRFNWERWATLRGRRMMVFSYYVSQSRSKWHVLAENLDIVPAYRGLVYVDQESRIVSRVTLEADDLPPSFPIQKAALTLDYDFATINETQYMLPLKAEMRLRQGRFLAKNEVEFRTYRKFGVEAVITFETPAPLPEEQLKEQPPQPKKP